MSAPDHQTFHHPPGRIECNSSCGTLKNKVNSRSTSLHHTSRSHRVIEAEGAPTGYSGRRLLGTTSCSMDTNHRKAQLLDTSTTSQRLSWSISKPRRNGGPHQDVIQSHPGHHRRGQHGWRDPRKSSDATQHLGSSSCAQTGSRAPTNHIEMLPSKVYEMSPTLQKSCGGKECTPFIEKEANVRNCFRSDKSADLCKRNSSNHVFNIKDTCKSQVVHKRENRDRPVGRQKTNDPQVVNRRVNREPPLVHRQEIQDFPMVQRQQERNIVIHRQKNKNLQVFQRKQHKDFSVVHIEENEDFSVVQIQENEDFSMVQIQENKDLPEIGRQNEDLLLAEKQENKHLSASYRQEKDFSVANREGNNDLSVAYSQENKEPLVVLKENGKSANSLLCPECGIQYKGQNALQRHLRQFNDNAERRLFKCYFCSHSFASRRRRNNHERIHGKGRRLPCCCCDRTFTSRDSILRHRHKQNIQMPPECPECGWVYASEKYLDDHLLRIQLNLPFQCFVCDHKYPSELALSRHLMFHRRRREFECAACLARFTTKELLVRHLSMAASKHPIRKGSTSASIERGSGKTSHRTSSPLITSGILR